MFTRAFKLTPLVMVLLAGSLGPGSAMAAGSPLAASLRRSAGRGLERVKQVHRNGLEKHRTARGERQKRREVNQKNRLEKHQARKEAKTRKRKATVVRETVSALINRMKNGEKLSEKDQQRLKEALAKGMHNGAGDQQAHFLAGESAKATWGRDLSNKMKKNMG